MRMMYLVATGLEKKDKIWGHYTVEPNKDWVRENPEVGSVVEWGNKRPRKLDNH